MKKFIQGAAMSTILMGLYSYHYFNAFGVALVLLGIALFIVIYKSK